VTFRSVVPAPPDALVQPAAGLPLLVGYLTTLAFLEWLLSVSVPLATGGFGLLALAGCVALPFTADERSQALLPVMTAIPVVRLIVVAAPTADFAPIPRLGLLALPTLIVVVLATRARHSVGQLFRLGPSGWATQLAVVLVAVPLAATVYLLMPVTPGARGHLPVIAAGIVLALAVVPDELLFRGLLQPAIAAAAGQRAGLYLSAMMYAATFIAYTSMGAVTAALAVGLALGWCRQRTGTVVGVVGARVVLVVLVYLVFPAIFNG